MSWLLPLVVVVGCGRVADWGTPRWRDAMLPHPAGWEEAPGHGTTFLERGSTACVGCHEVEPGGEFCGECHDSYPHSEGWLDGSEHGEGTFGKYGELQPCQDCHELEGSAAAALACTSCHGSYPHEDGWEGAGEHGAYLVERGGVKLACSPCHGEDLTGGEVSDPCSSCHASYPHPEGWELGVEHGNFDAPGRDGVRASGCQRCHGDAAGGLAGIACARCHASYPHGGGWTSAHVPRAGALGEGSCMTCHDASDGPSAMPASCSPTCHGGAQ